MWPRTIPNWVSSEPRRAAEISVYRRLEKELDDQWGVFYSRPWWGVNSRGGEVDGEADFILVHPTHGLLFLEVKGGGISYDPCTEKWKTRDRDGITHSIKDPVNQAMTCKHQFMKKLKAIPNWPRGYVRFRHGVVFPDTAPPPVTAATLGGHEKRLFCHREEFDNALEPWIRERLAPHTDDPARGEIGPGDVGITAIHELLAKPATLRVPMVREIQGDLLEMEATLTGAQLASIAWIESLPRVLVEGGAGTGKTVLAMEIAAREADGGHAVLFCCRSFPLSRNVAARLSHFKTVEVLTYDELLARVRDLHRAGQEYPWDTVLVDEAQDFDWEWWDVLERICEQRETKFRVFADSNQAIYRTRDDLETRLRAQCIPLLLNLRNTQRIAKVTDSLYRGPLIKACGPEGYPPEIKVCDYETAKRLAADTLVQLVRQEDIPASMIAVLLPRADAAEALRRSLGRCGLVVTDATGGHGPGVAIDSVDRFKGLEAAVVLIVSDKELCRNQELSYVGVSRSRARLFVFGPIGGSLLDQALSVVS